ncbi:hypothetical protein NKR23_g727 [Pleurostoma richardsiae]|uniref:Uncharacterized protein n=1 Tax=Pleurostoma richardsiae TaxID=41990 RepID=A0AA38VXQ0_9PEZI|nr:hypothetical protein NKR23_g727 [Pleurostoma richardsiae]
MAERETRKETTDVLSTRPNGRGAAPTLENRRTAGKGSFARRESKENVAAEMAATGAQRRPTSSGSSSDNRVTSPQSSRIPRPSQQQTGSRTRRPLTFSEAYKLAEEQEAMRGSPSPAPRTWRTKGDQEDRNIQTLFSQKPVDLGRRRRQARRSDEAIRGDDTISSLDSTGSGSHKSEGSDDFDRKLQQYAEDKARLEGMLTAKNGIFSKSKVGPRVAETGHELHRKTSSNSLESGSPPQRTWGNLAKPDPNWLKRIISNPDKQEICKCPPALL